MDNTKDGIPEKHAYLWHSWFPFSSTNRKHNITNTDFTYIKNILQ